ncbi:MAG: IclR family transcriptional regulator [Planctomycetes bacterium]|nr:IclR family transcriptional regulator [Planctomycetota bacterium]
MESSRPSAVTTQSVPWPGDEPPDARLFVNSLAKGLQVLRAFGNGPAAMTIAEVATATGLGRSSAQRLVYTLERLRYLQRDAATRAYRLTPRALDLGYAFLQHDVLVEHAARTLGEIARFSEEAASLTELDDVDIVVLARLPSQHLFSVNVLQGMRFPAWCSAPGRAMLAFLPPEQIDSVLDRSRIEPITPHTITDPARLHAALDEVRTHGFALAVEELFLGTLSIAAPVVGSRGDARAAINLLCPTVRWPAERARAELGPLLVQKSRELSQAAAPGTGRS